ncbi:MAG TPA: hypothetical protein DC022_15840, partial [Alcanivorax sp.]|nr:hypothetical protein [Alcanivorax sp.]
MSATDASRPAAGRFYRKELVALLDHCVRVPLTLLLAPAGAGKSTLLSQWQSGGESRAVVSL